MHGCTMTWCSDAIACAGTACSPTQAAPAASTPTNTDDPAGAGAQRPNHSSDLSSDATTPGTACNGGHHNRHRAAGARATATGSYTDGATARVACSPALSARAIRASPAAAAAARAGATAAAGDARAIKA